MNREIHQWWSPRLNKNMEIVAYGHFGPALLMLPTAAADYLEYERFYLVDQLAPYIEAGKIKVFSVNSINSESWLNNRMMPHHKAIRHNQFNWYIFDEVVPFIYNHCQSAVPIITTGASLGAFHAMNLFLHRPDLFYGTIAMSGVYDLTSYSDGFMNEDVYFNSPVHYMPSLSDHHTLELLRRSKIIIATGSGAYEAPSASQKMSEILWSKSVPNELDVWGPDMRHDWPTWRAMLPYFVGSRL
jgi:esterase/lipase superfamily enzyme